MNLALEFNLYVGLRRRFIFVEKRTLRTRKRKAEQVMQPYLADLRNVTIIEKFAAKLLKLLYIKI